MLGQCLLSINARRRVCHGLLPSAFLNRELALGNLVTFDIAQPRTLVSTHARIRRCHDGRVERGFKLLEHVRIVQQRDVTGTEVDHIVFGKCFREWKRQRVKAQVSSTGQRGARLVQYGSRRSAAYIRLLASSQRSWSLNSIPPILAPADPPDAVCHSTAALIA